MLKKASIKITWDADKLAALKKLTRARRKPYSDLVRELVEAWMACHLSHKELAPLGIMYLHEPHIFGEAIASFNAIHRPVSLVPKTRAPA